MKEAACLLLICLLISVTHADITWSGDVVPANPATWTSNTEAHIGYTGDGTMGITHGSVVINRYGYIGSNPSSIGAVVVDGSGSTWTNSSILCVGGRGKGTLDIINGGVVTDDVGIIGNDFDSMGAVTVDGFGSTWTNSIRLYVGEAGDGTLEITNGGTVNSSSGCIAWNYSSTGAVTVNGIDSKWTIDSFLYVGVPGNGTLNISDGGLVSVAETLTIGHDGGGDSFVNMATDGMLALYDSSWTSGDDLTDFLALVDGPGAINYWDGLAWADITGATYGVDYTLTHLTTGNLNDYTVLTVTATPEPATLALLGLGGLLVRRKKR